MKNMASETYVQHKSKFMIWTVIMKIKISKTILWIDKQVNFNQIQNSDAKYSAEEGFGLCGHFLIGLSYFMLIIGMPFTLCCCMKVIN